MVEVIFTKPIAVTELVNEAVTIFEQRSDRHFIVSARKRIDITNGIFRVSVTNENSVIEIKDLKRDLETVFRDITKN